MIFTPTPIDGAYLIELEPRVDDRGSFARAFCKRELAQHGLSLDIVQCNLARTRKAGLVRGLHYQTDPDREAKLVRCITGAVLDAIIDMRRGSPSFRKTYSVRLDPKNRYSLFIPGGVAHGYQALEDDTEFLYMTDEYYVAGTEKGVRFDDPRLGIEWPLPPRDVTQRDRSWPPLD